MSDQTEFDFMPDQPEQVTPALRVTGVGVIRDNLDIDHLMGRLDRIGLKHHDCALDMSTDIEADEFGYF